MTATNAAATVRPVDVAVIGGGPAGLMAAEVARAAGLSVHVYERMGSVGRKFLIAGKGGLNLTHSEPVDAFRSRYGNRTLEVSAWLDGFDAQAVRAWARGLGIETHVGSSGRVFPLDFKAAPLLRGWVRRLREQGVAFHVNHEWTGLDDSGASIFRSTAGDVTAGATATVLALGGASWPQLGSDGSWFGVLGQMDVLLAPFRPANCGFEVNWTEHFSERHAGAPIKPVHALGIGPHAADDAAGTDGVRGEFLITRTGVEGSLIYALSAQLRAEIERNGHAILRLDLAPDRTRERLLTDFSEPPGKRSLANRLRTLAGITGAKAGLVHEILLRGSRGGALDIVDTIKCLPLRLERTRPIAEAISTAGGVRFDALDPQQMLRSRPSVFCAGEMVDWEAPTGGYLLTASLASGHAAGLGAVHWIDRIRQHSTQH